MRETSPIEWFQVRFCKVCKNRVCVKRGSGTYSIPTNESIVPCVLAMLLMESVERNIIKSYRKEG